MQEKFAAPISRFPRPRRSPSSSSSATQPSRNEEAAPAFFASGICPGNKRPPKSKLPTTLFSPPPAPGGKQPNTPARIILPAPKFGWGGPTGFVEELPPAATTQP